MELELVKEIKEVSNLTELNRFISNGWVILAIANRSFFKPFVFCIGKCHSNIHTEKSGMVRRQERKATQDNN
ncbi:MAG: hypothetical protein GQ532_06315 [Methylomarinum sp.]|nr:hypothetical protein [Methylomarinum sp.]